MRVLVTGAAGRVGRWLSDYLSAADYGLVLADLQPLEITGATFEYLDCLDALCVGRLMQKHRPNAVVHLANHANLSAAEPTKLYAENVKMTANVLQSAADHGVEHVVYSSSIQVVSGSDGSWQGNHDVRLRSLPLDGETPPNPSNLYAQSKQSGEQLLRHYATIEQAYVATALRLPFVCSDKALERMRATLSRKAGDTPKHVGTEVDMRAQEAFAYIAAEDCASLVDAVLQRPETGYRCYQASGAIQLEGISYTELLAARYPGVQLTRPGEAFDGLVDLSGLQRDLDWAPKSPPLVIRKSALS